MSVAILAQAILAQAILAQVCNRSGSGRSVRLLGVRGALRPGTPATPPFRLEGRLGRGPAVRGHAEQCARFPRLGARAAI